MSVSNQVFNWHLLMKGHCSIQHCRRTFRNKWMQQQTGNIRFSSYSIAYKNMLNFKKCAFFSFFLQSFQSLHSQGPPDHSGLLKFLNRVQQHQLWYSGYPARLTWTFSEVGFQAFQRWVLKVFEVGFQSFQRGISWQFVYSTPSETKLCQNLTSKPNQWYSCQSNISVTVHIVELSQSQRWNSQKNGPHKTFWMSAQGGLAVHLVPMCVCLFFSNCLDVTGIFLATLVALHFTPVRESVSQRWKKRKN